MYEIIPIKQNIYIKDTKKSKSFVILFKSYFVSAMNKYSLVWKIMPPIYSVHYVAASYVEIIL